MFGLFFVVSSQVQAPTIATYQEHDNLPILSGNTLKGHNMPLKVDTMTYGLILATRNEIKEVVGEKYPELYRIISCESSWREKVCSYAGCGAGMGLAQIIPNTLLYCEKKLGKKLDVFNGEDNLECALWLYENEGNGHWFPSKDCWDIE